MVDTTWIPALTNAFTDDGLSVTFKALYQDAQSDVRFGLVTADEPVITFEAAYCNALTNGDTVVIGEVSYKVRDGGNFKDSTARRFRIRKVAAA